MSASRTRLAKPRKVIQSETWLHASEQSAPGLRRLRAEALALIILRRAFGASAPKAQRSENK